MSHFAWCVAEHQTALSIPFAYYPLQTVKIQHSLCALMFKSLWIYSVSFTFIYKYRPWRESDSSMMDLATVGRKNSLFIRAESSIRVPSEVEGKKKKNKETTNDKHKKHKLWETVEQEVIWHWHIMNCCIVPFVPAVCLRRHQDWNQHWQ